MRFPFILVFFLAFTNSIGNDKAKLSIKDEPNIVYPVWANWIKYRDTWILVPIYNQDGEAIIRVWAKGEEISELIRTDARIGVSYISTAAVNQNGTVAIQGLLKPVIYNFPIGNPGEGFTKVQPAIELSGNMAFWDDSTLIGGTNKLKLKSYGHNRISELSQINKQLPDAKHPSQGKVNHHKILIAKTEGKLAIGYTLSNKLTIFNLIAEHPVPKYSKVSFSGYIEPPHKYIKEFTNQKDNEYMNSFHHLVRISWFNGELFGFFRKGYDGHGIWASLSNPEFLWDNNNNDIKIIAIENDEIVLGKTHSSNGEIDHWLFWRSSSLPL